MAIDAWLGGHRRVLPLLLGLIVAILVGTSVATLSRAAVGADPARVEGTGSIGTGASTQTVVVSAQTYGEAAASFSLTEGDPASSPAPVVGTVSCVANWNGVISIGVVLDDGRQGVVAISDGAPSGVADTLTFDFVLGGPDCTASYPPGTPLTSGDFTVGPLACLPGPPPGGSTVDANGDSIADVLQPQGRNAGTFCDGSTTVPTDGSSFDTGGLRYFVEDAASPTEGVLAMVFQGPLPSGPAPTPGDPGNPFATFRACGYDVHVYAGSQTAITCASVRVRSITGTAAVDFGSGDATVVIPGGAAAEVTTNADGSFTVENVGTGSALISVTIGGTTTPIGPGDSITASDWSFIGFDQPVDNPPTANIAKAGQAVPLRWRVVDGNGAPVTTITNVTLTTGAISCGLVGGVDAIEEGSPVGGGLRHLGNGNYELVWKSPKSYAGSCRVLRLAIGDGAIHEALFQFKP